MTMKTARALAQLEALKGKYQARRDISCPDDAPGDVYREFIRDIAKILEILERR